GIFSRKTAINKNQRAGSRRGQISLELLARDRRRAVPPQLEARLRDRRYISEAPVLDAAPREPDFAKSRERVSTQVLQPGHVTSGRCLLKTREALRVVLELLLCCRCHADSFLLGIAVSF